MALAQSQEYFLTFYFLKNCKTTPYTYLPKEINLNKVLNHVNPPI